MSSRSDFFGMRLGSRSHGGDQKRLFQTPATTVCHSTLHKSKLLSKHVTFVTVYVVDFVSVHCYNSSSSGSVEWKPKFNRDCTSTLVRGAPSLVRGWVDSEQVLSLLFSTD